ncbi:hypothetical protein B0A49_10735 [Cryomyces minteri]|uniref:Uncharacterized protein n=1 Tax=Cryomyces minteri TaxID=331657 RepID=A0A4U0X2N8_9PEZI|nr:hypothetical protein B0A49_10735 [Cryomyces minteri]
MYTIITVVTLSIISAVQAHMQLTYPPPFQASNNPYTTGPADPYLQYPFDCCGPGDRWDYPCRGYLKLLGTPAGRSVAEWPAGSAQAWNMSGIGNHYGGSCQVGFSVDNGTTFQVATSYEGNCPHRDARNDAAGQNFDFTVPADMPTGHMNCAAVTITAPKAIVNGGYNVGSTTAAATEPASSESSGHATADNYTDLWPFPRRGRSLLHFRRADTMFPKISFKHGLKHGVRPAHVHKRAVSSSIPYAQRPGMLVADAGNGCLTPRTTAEVKYPHPGPDVVLGDGEYPLELPTPADKCGY